MKGYVYSSKEGRKARSNLPLLSYGCSYKQSYKIYPFKIALSKNISTHILTCKLQETATDTSNSRWIIWQFSRENFFSLIIWHLTWKTYDVEVKLKGWFVHVKSSKMTSTLFDFLLTFFSWFFNWPQSHTEVIWNSGAQYLYSINLSYILSIYYRYSPDNTDFGDWKIPC